jgi:hypothetical protein
MKSILVPIVSFALLAACSSATSETNESAVIGAEDAGSKYDLFARVVAQFDGSGIRREPDGSMVRGENVIPGPNGFIGYRCETGQTQCTLFAIVPTALFPDNKASEPVDVPVKGSTAALLSISGASSIDCENLDGPYCVLPGVRAARVTLKVKARPQPEEINNGFLSEMEADLLISRSGF